MIFLLHALGELGEVLLDGEGARRRRRGELGGASGVVGRFQQSCASSKDTSRGLFSERIRFARCVESTKIDRERRLAVRLLKDVAKLLLRRSGGLAGGEENIVVIFVIFSVRRRRSRRRRLLFFFISSC